MTNQRQIILHDGRVVETTVQTFEELETLAIQMESGSYWEVIDLFMLDEVGNVVRDAQPIPQKIRIVPTIRYG
jgi:hypothetical protein